MKIIRYTTPDHPTHYGLLHPEGKVTRADGELFAGLVDTGEVVENYTLLAPVDPRAVYCIGLNYRAHAAETGAKLPEYPVLFMKSPAALQHPGEPIRLPRQLRSEKVDFEGELAVVIGKTCKNVSPKEALDYVLGYVCANDVSARDWQREYGGSQWCRGKTFDTFLPLGPCLVTPDELGNPQALQLRTLVNGEVMQESSTADMIFPVAQLISFLSGSSTLLPGSVILTGTPSGVGMARTPQVWLQPGDIVQVDISGIGVLVNPVLEEEVAEAGEKRPFYLAAEA
jgi:2-keto-4-pentenoate hydratase/2-oxohepta-3-ene-1,7-dioic acid hydratase in catechol pathway